MRTLSIVRLGEGWTITGDGRRLGDFDYRVDAEEAALRLAEKARQSDAAVEILAQDLWGKVKRVS